MQQYLGVVILNCHFFLSLIVWQTHKIRLRLGCGDIKLSMFYSLPILVYTISVDFRVGFIMFNRNIEHSGSNLCNPCSLNVKHFNYHENLIKMMVVVCYTFLYVTMLTLVSSESLKVLRTPSNLSTFKPYSGGELINSSLYGLEEATICARFSTYRFIIHGYLAMTQIF